MKISLPTGLLGVVLAALAGGCGPGPDCAPSLEQAQNAAAERLPLAAWIESVPQQCRTPATQAWEEMLAEDCAPLYGFHQGRSGSGLPEHCDRADFTSAYNLGQMLGELERERAEIKHQLANAEALPDSRRRDLRQRRVVIERDLPQVRALARMGGFMPPAEVPQRRD